MSTIKRNKRDRAVTIAEVELSKVMIDIVKKHDLTFGEISAILSEEIQWWAESQIRDERASKGRK